MEQTPTDPSRPLRVGIIGSCISRDSVEQLDAEHIEITYYVARHSLVSAGSDLGELFPADHGLESAFQERILRDDFSGVSIRALIEKSATADAILWDLADERGGVYAFDSKSGPRYVTRSFDTERSERFAELFDGVRHIPFGSDEHFALWKPAAKSCVATFHAEGMLDKAILLKAPWALVMKDSTLARGSFNLMPAEANALYERYYEVLENLGVKTVEPDPATLIGDPDHVWGAAPFHYVPEFYQSILDGIEAATGLTLARK